MKKSVKLMALTLALAILMSAAAFTVSAEGVGFADVQPTDYFYDAVQWGVGSGITSGVGENLFAPDGKVTRAQMVTFLWRMAGEPEAEGDSNFFDVFTDSDLWYTKPVIWATNNGIVEGYIEGAHKVFKPEAVCNRAMCITLLYRLMGSPLDGIDLSSALKSVDGASFGNIDLSLIKETLAKVKASGGLSDVPEDSYYALPVIWACLNGIITKDNTGDITEGAKFRSLDPCVRKEMISFLYRITMLSDDTRGPETYGFGKITVPIPRKYSERLYIKAADNGGKDPETGEETLIIVSELASIKAAEALGEKETAGIGELFRIIKTGENRIHELLCSDMSGLSVFAEDEEGNYYILCTPTDVRYMRENNEKMSEDINKWTELNEWARGKLISEIFKINSNLTAVNYTNTMLDMYLARIAYAKDVKYTLSTTEFGPLEPGKVDGLKFAEYLLAGNFEEVENKEAPDGEYVVLNFPDEDVRFDFFRADTNLVREVRGDYETIYKRVLPGYTDNTEVMESWYLTIAEQAGKKEDFKEIDPFLGKWREEIAGRGYMEITKSVGLAKADIEVSWPSSAAEVSNWSITANLASDGKLVYYSGRYTETEYDEEGNETLIVDDNDISGVFSLTKDGKLIWQMSDHEEDTATFVRAE